MRIASIDIGTNTILMLIGEVDPTGSLHVIQDEHAIARLGRGVDGQRLIPKDSFYRASEVLQKYITIARAHNVDAIIACGTSALRDATNREEFLKFIREILALPIRILSGSEEARMTYRGALSDILRGNSQHYGVLDIGGGSTELISGIGMKVDTSVSIDIGSVRLTERILKHSPPAEESINEFHDVVDAALSTIHYQNNIEKLIGVAGTLTTLAAIDLQLSKYDKLAIQGHVLSLSVIDRIYKALRPLNYDQLCSYPQIHPDRADILLAGIMILRKVLRYLGLQNIEVSVNGLRHGLLLEYMSTMEQSTSDHS